MSDDDKNFRVWMSEIPSKDEFDWESRFLSWCVHVPNDDMLHFHHPDWVEYVKSMLYSLAPFNPIRPDRRFVFEKSCVTQQLLPNSTYRALLLHVIKMVPHAPRRILTVLGRMLMAMEENNITGYVHVPVLGAFIPVLKGVRATFARFDVTLDRAYVYVHPSIVRSVLLCNTSVVFLIHARLRHMEATA